METGWIKIHRKMLEWEWYSDTNVVRVFLHLLLTANHKDRNWRGMTIKRGQIVSGRKRLAKTLGLSQQIIRRCLVCLKSTNEITIKTTNRFSVLTIVKYDEYQVNDAEATNETTSQSTNKQPTNNQQTTTPKEYKKERTKEKEEVYPPEFLEFWNLYPRRVAKGSAYKAYKQSKAEHTKIMEALRKSLLTLTQREKEFIPHPSTWLNQRRWEDETSNVLTLEQMKGKYL